MLNIFSKVLIIICFTIGLFESVVAVASESDSARRTVLMIYDWEEKPVLADSADSWLHRYLSLPMNHYGLKVDYFDIDQAKPLPQGTQIEDIYGVAVCLKKSTSSRAKELLSWLRQLSDKGRHILLMCNPGYMQEVSGQLLTNADARALFQNLGLSLEKGTIWADQEYYQLKTVDQNIMGFESPAKFILTAEGGVSVRPTTDAHVALSISDKQDLSDEYVLVSHGLRGSGYIAPGYFSVTESHGNAYSWTINPWQYLEQVFQLKNKLIPDTTTLVGGRIYYSHVDGDGWNNISEVTMNGRQLSSSEVLLKEIYEKYDDLPVTVGPVVAEIDPDWYGQANSLQLAKDTLTLPNVEAGTHTFTHPFDWNFYALRERQNKPNKSWDDGDSGYFGRLEKTLWLLGTRIGIARYPVD